MKKSGNNIVKLFGLGIVLLMLMVTLGPICAADDPVDSDGDGLFDNEEIEQGTDPNNPDTDDDGLDDYDEVCIHHTNPLDPDSDDDGYTDLDEVINGWNPNDYWSPGIIYIQIGVLVRTGQPDLPFYKVIVGGIEIENYFPRVQK